MRKAQTGGYFWAVAKTVEAALVRIVIGLLLVMLAVQGMMTLPGASQLLNPVASLEGVPFRPEAMLAVAEDGPCLELALAEQYLTNGNRITVWRNGRQVGTLEAGRLFISVRDGDQLALQAPVGSEYEVRVAGKTPEILSPVPGAIYQWQGGILFLVTVYLQGAED